MPPNSDYSEMRDAVIKLETKMEVMSDSMTTMADAVSKLADMKYDLVSVSKDIANLAKISEKQDESITLLFKRQRVIEEKQHKSSYLLGKVDLFWSALITGGAAFLWWLLRG